MLDSPDPVWIWRNQVPQCIHPNPKFGGESIYSCMVSLQLILACLRHCVGNKIQDPRLLVLQRHILKLIWGIIWMQGSPLTSCRWIGQFSPSRWVGSAKIIPIVRMYQRCLMIWCYITRNGSCSHKAQNYNEKEAISVEGPNLGLHKIYLCVIEVRVQVDTPTSWQVLAYVHQESRPSSGEWCGQLHSRGHGSGMDIMLGHTTKTSVLIVTWNMIIVVWQEVVAPPQEAWISPIKVVLFSLGGEIFDTFLGIN